MRYQFFYKSFLLESRFKRAESRDLKTFLQKYVSIPDVMYSFRSKLVSTNYPSGINPSIGINPRNRYNTPTGIYGYPLEETFHKLMTDSLEFATERPIVIVYKPKNNVPIVRTSTFSEKDLEEKLKILEKLFLLSSEQMQLEIDGLDSRYKKSPAQTLWTLVRALTNQNVNKWATTMISIGVPVFIDDNESGTIHSAEPTQCVVFGKNFVEIIGVYEKPIISSKLSSISKVGDIIINSLWNSLDPTLLTLDEKLLFYADRKIMHILKYISEFENEDRFNLTLFLLNRINDFIAKTNVKEESVTLLFEKYLSIVIPKTFETSLDLKEVLNLFNRLFFSKSNLEFIKRIKKIIINRLSESIKEINSLWNFLVVSSFDLDYINDVDFQDSLFSLLSENSEKIQEKLIDFSNLSQKHILELSKEMNEGPSYMNMKAGNISNFLNFCMSNFKDASFIMTDFVLLAARIFEKYLRVSYDLHDIDKTQLYKSLYEILEYIKYKNPKMYKDLQTEEIVLNFQERVVEKVIYRIGELEDQTTKLLVDLFVKNGPTESLSGLYVSVRIALNDRSYKGRQEIYEEIQDILEERLEDRISSGKVYEETWYNSVKKGYSSIEKFFFERLDLYLAKILDEVAIRRYFSVEKLIDFLTNDASKVTLSLGTYEGDVDLKKDKERFLQLNNELQPETFYVYLSSFWFKYFVSSNVLPKLISIYSEEIEKADLGDIKI